MTYSLFDDTIKVILMMIMYRLHSLYTTRREWKKHTVVVSSVFIRVNDAFKVGGSCLALIGMSQHVRLIDSLIWPIKIEDRYLDRKDRLMTRLFTCCTAQLVSSYDATCLFHLVEKLVNDHKKKRLISTTTYVSMLFFSNWLSLVCFSEEICFFD